MPETAREEAEALTARIDKALIDYDAAVDMAWPVTAQSQALLAGLLREARALLSVPETENWEYGVKPHPDEEEVYRFGEDAARHAVASGPREYVLMRRTPSRPAGRWEPVPVEEDNR